MKKNILNLLFTVLLFSCGSSMEDKTNDTSSRDSSTLSITGIRQQIKAYPDSFLLKENLIQLLRDSGNYKAAIEQTRSFLHQDSINPRLFHMLGFLYFENGDTLQAIHAFEQSYQIIPDPQELILAGKLHALKGNPQSMIIADTLMASRLPENALQAYFIRGLFFENRHEYAKAIEAFEECLKLDYTQTEVYLEKAKSQCEIDKWNDAIVTLKKAVTIRNNFAEGYLLLAQCYEHQKNNKSAAEAYRRNLLYEPENEEALEGLERVTED